MRRITFALFFISTLIINACGNPAPRPDSSTTSQAPNNNNDIGTTPKAIKKLQSVGITVSAYVVTSLDPDKKVQLTLNPDNGNFKGTVEVPANTPFDLKVVYTADDPVTGETLPVAYYTRKNVIATGPNTPVKYDGEESQWQTAFDLTPGTPNELNLDGDAYSNFVEIGYGSHVRKADDLPKGAKATATRPDPINGSDAQVALPP